VAITRAPAAAAYCTANPPTPPVAPAISTGSPPDRASASTAFSAAVPARPSAPASDMLSPSGTAVRPYASPTVTYSASDPVPRTGFITTPNTASPGAKRDVPSPTASTTPAKSLPTTSGKRCSIMPCNIPAVVAASKPLIDEAATRTSTSPASGFGVGKSMSCGEAGTAGTATARIGCPFANWRVSSGCSSQPYHANWRMYSSYPGRVWP
jgi:hypothetical protein